jgi:hypothetical protein
MLRHHHASGGRVPVRLLCSARSLELLIHRQELGKLATDSLAEVTVTLARETPDDWPGYCG